MTILKTCGNNLPFSGPRTSPVYIPRKILFSTLKDHTYFFAQKRKGRREETSQLSSIILSSFLTILSTPFMETLGAEDFLTFLE